MTTFDPADPWAIDNPAWVMYGFEKPDGTVQVWATRDVTRAEAPMPEPEEWQDLQDDIRNPKIRLNVTMKKLTMVRGNTWRQAFVHLFRRWSPDDVSVMQELPAAQQKVEGR